MPVEEAPEGSHGPDEESVNRQFADIISRWDATPPADLGDAPPIPDDPPPGSVESLLGEDRFEPPQPRLPGQEDLAFWGIVVGLTIGPAALLAILLFGDGWSPLWTYAAAGLTLAGLVLLFLRQPTHRDDSDDGARV